MTAKQYLRQLALLEQQLNTIAEELEERRTRLASPAAPVLAEKVQSSPTGDAFARAVAQIADKDIQRQELAYKYEALRDKIVDQILAIPNYLYELVLYERYVKHRTLIEIAEQANYSYTRICHVHGAALVEFSKRYPEEVDNK